MEKILFVDDEKSFRDASQRLLMGAGYSVDVARDGVEAIAFLERDEYDFIITDIVMPNKEGISLIMEIKKNKIKSKIIAISGGGRGSPYEYLKMAKAFDVDATLTKPYSFTDLLLILEKLSSNSTS